jgi:hypothetical protein
MQMLRRVIKRVLFGKKRNYKKYHNNGHKSLIFENNRRINNLQDTVNNLMKHLKVSNIGRSNLVVSKKDAEKFNGQW